MGQYEKTHAAVQVHELDVAVEVLAEALPDLPTTIGRRAVDVLADREVELAEQVDDEVTHCLCALDLAELGIEVPDVKQVRQPLELVRQETPADACLKVQSG